MTILNRQRTHRIHSRGLEAFVHRVARVAPRRSKTTVVPPADRHSAHASVAVCLVSDVRMREINRRYRDRDAPTDVLSFPGDDEPEPDGTIHVGDIVISVSTAARQARALGHSLPRELKLLTLHAYLHLLGYDHESDDGTMLRLERRLARRLLPALRKRRPAARDGQA